MEPFPREQAWRGDVLLRFDRAAHHYSNHAGLQRGVAWRLASLCRRRPLQPGLWVDLGAGTGLLAAALETLHPGQNVHRVDGSEAMLRPQLAEHTTQQWDLQQGLPRWSVRPQLLASSFCLHWLDAPSQRVQEWFQALAPSGWLAVALPVNGSFHQWHQAAARSGQICTALPLPTGDKLLDGIPAKALRHSSIHTYTESAGSVAALLRPMRRIGAGSTPLTPLGVSAWRQLSRSWPERNADGLVRLTWMVQILLLQR